MFYTVTLWAAVAVFVAGISYKAFLWFARPVGPASERLPFNKRLLESLKSVSLGILSPRLLSMGRALVVDVLLQWPVLKKSKIRWVMHMLIYAGITGLILMHALEDYISANIFDGYEASLNPWFFLRDLFGVLALAGLAVAAWRRRRVAVLKGITGASDRWVLILLAAILLSGFLLEGVKQITARNFYRMAEDYGTASDPEELAPLEAYWAKEFGVVFQNPPDLTDQDLLETGREEHEMNCAGCHARPEWAFLSNSLARPLKPAALWLDDLRADDWLFGFHYLAALFGLALLPFTKLFHILTTPLNLLARAGSSPGPTLADPTLRALELDACTRCGACSMHCSVGLYYRTIVNQNVQPSEILKSIRKISNGGLSSKELDAVREGTYLCTDCRRCTRICPAGINLHDMWGALRQKLDESGYPEPKKWARQMTVQEYGPAIRDHGRALKMDRSSLKELLSESLLADTFQYCYSCFTCSSGCPVVTNFKDPVKELDLTPHQIIRALALGDWELALGSRMIWDCFGCYKCQENCPQGVRVADIIYELKNLSYSRFRESGAPMLECRKPGCIERSNRS